jgi:hypothetical protein
MNCQITRTELLDVNNKLVLCEGENYRICSKCQHRVADHINPPPQQSSTPQAGE